MLFFRVAEDGMRLVWNVLPEPRLVPQKRLMAQTLYVDVVPGPFVSVRELVWCDTNHRPVCRVEVFDSFVHLSALHRKHVRQAKTCPQKWAWVARKSMPIAIIYSSAKGRLDCVRNEENTEAQLTNGINKIEKLSIAKRLNMAMEQPTSFAEAALSMIVCS